MIECRMIVAELISEQIVFILVMFMLLREHAEVITLGEYALMRMIMQLVKRGQRDIDRICFHFIIIMLLFILFS